MNAALAESLAAVLDRRLAGEYLGRTCRPDRWTLAFELSGGLTLGFCWEPLSLAVGLCRWTWPRGACEEILARHAQGSRILTVRAIPGEPILVIGLSGSLAASLVWEAIGRSANAFLLGEGDAVLWSGRLLRGPNRSGRTGEAWIAPPPQAGHAPLASISPAEAEAFLETEGPALLRQGLLDRGRREAIKRLDHAEHALQRRAEAVGKDRTEGEAWTAIEPLAQSLISSGDLAQRGERERLVTDYTRDPPEEVALPLDPALTVRENAEAMFRRSQKGRARLAATAEVIAAIGRRQEALPAEREALMGTEDLHVLFPDHAESGRSKPLQRRRTLPPGVAALPLPRDFAGYAGKNAAGNDTVSFRIGRGGDFWFHAEDYAGCHVVVRCPAKTETLPFDVEQAAALYAAAHSGAPPGSRVAVAVSRCKHLRRVPGSLGRVMVGWRRVTFVDLQDAR